MKKFGWMLFGLALFLTLGLVAQSGEMQDKEEPVKTAKEKQDKENPDKTAKEKKQDKAPKEKQPREKKDKTKPASGDSENQSVEEIGKKLVAGGPALIEKLLGEVGEKFGDKKGVSATTSLHALVIYSSRPKADSERQWVAETLAKQLEGKYSVDTKSFIITQLQLCGREKEVPALAKFLSDERLCEPATQALLAIRGDAALAALRAELPKAEGKRRVTLNQAVEIMTKK